MQPNPASIEGRRDGVEFVRPGRADDRSTATAQLGDAAELLGDPHHVSVAVGYREEAGAQIEVPPFITRRNESPDRPAARAAIPSSTRSRKS